MSIERSKIWKNAFNHMKLWTNIVQSLPDREVIFNRALHAVRAAAHAQGQTEDCREIAGEITSYVITHYDRSKVRPPNKTTRIQREKRNRQVIDTYTAITASGDSITSRGLAAKLGRSNSQVARILRENGIAPKAEKSLRDLDEHVVAAIRILQQLVPKDGARIVASSLLTEQIFGDVADFTDQTLCETLEAVSTSRAPFHCYPSGDRIIVSRGRKLSLKDIGAKFTKGRDSTTVAPRRPLDRIGSLVFRDLMSAVAVSSMQPASDDWRTFVAVFTLRTDDLNKLQNVGSTSGQSPKNLEAAHKLVCDDPAALATRVSMAIRNSKEMGVKESIRSRNQSYRPWSSCLSELLYLIEYCDGGGYEHSARIWIAVTCYRERVAAGLLPARDAREIDMFLDAARASDLSETSLRDLLEMASKPSVG